LGSLARTAAGRTSFVEATRPLLKPRGRRFDPALPEAADRTANAISCRGAVRAQNTPFTPNVQTAPVTSTDVGTAGALPDFGNVITGSLRRLRPVKKKSVRFVSFPWRARRHRKPRRAQLRGRARREVERVTFGLLPAQPGASETRPDLFRSLDSQRATT